MNSWTQIVVKGTVRDIRSQMDARQLPAYRSFYNPAGQRPYRDSFALVPSEPHLLAKLEAWFSETTHTECKPGVGFPAGTLLWFGPFVGKVPTKSLHRISEYAPLEDYLQEFAQ